MIRINLLGRNRPKAQRTTVPLEATLQYVLLAVASASVASPFGFIRVFSTGRTPRSWRISRGRPARKRGSIS